MVVERQKAMQLNVSEVQHQLVQMLDSVQLDAPSVSGTDTSGRTEGFCPNCRSLDSWGMSTWCPACGYYPALGRFVAPDETEEESAEPQSLHEAIPQWAWWLGAGMAVIFFESLLLRVYLSEVPRGIVALLQLAIGVFVYITGYLRAYFKVSHQTDKITVTTLFFGPGTIWQQVFRQLPETQRSVCAGAWGALACICAVLIIGLNWDALVEPLKAMHRPRRINPMQWIMSAASAAEGSVVGEEPEMVEFSQEDSAISGGAIAVPESDARSLEGAVGDFAGAGPVQTVTAGGGQRTSSLPGSSASGLDGESEQTPAGEVSTAESKTHLKDPSEDVGGQEGTPELGFEEFVIFGYLANGKGELRSLLLADCSDPQRPRFSGKLALGKTEQGIREELQAILKTIPARRAALRTPYRARWVRPIVCCKVRELQIGPDGRLQQGEVMEITNQPEADHKTFSHMPTRSSMRERRR